MFFFALSTLDKIIMRITGPMGPRFIFQPLAAIILGIRDGKLDAKANEPPFIYNVIFNPKLRKKQFAKAFESMLRPIIISIILDIIAQYLIFKQVRLIGALVVGTFVMGIPYVFARALTNRIVSGKKIVIYKEESNEN